MRIAVALGACAALAALAGCGASGGTGTPGAESSVVTGGTAPSSPGAGTSGGGGTSSGGNDPDAPDTPVGGGQQGSASLPSLPIGGSVSFEAESAPTCAFLAWNGDDLPDGVAVRIDDLGLPAGVVEDSGGSCDAPPCLGADSFTSEQGSCAVRLSWDGTPSTDEPSISASGRVVGESQDACDQVQEAAASGGGVASVELPEIEESESTEPSESTESSEPSESTEPSESPASESAESTDDPDGQAESS